MVSPSSGRDTGDLRHHARGYTERMGRSRRRRPTRPLGIIALAVAAETVALKLRADRLGGNVVVRCGQGHLFTTLWIPGASLKSIRFGWWRFQWCPVGRHWSIVTPLRASELTEEERRFATSNKDIRIP
jgi:hypothetical protein